VKLADALDTSVDYLLCRTKISAAINRLVTEDGVNGGSLPFFEAYSRLHPDDQSLMMERMLTLYDARKMGSVKKSL
jgi:hypothetical protein